MCKVSADKGEAQTMRIMILGAGEVGFNIASRLSSEGHDVVVVDRSPEKIERLGSQLDVQAILGSGTSPRILKEAGIDESDMLIAATDSDEVNLLACFMASNLNKRLIKVARVKNQEYQNPKFLGKDLLGIDHIINPGRAMVESIINILEHPWATDITDLAGGKVKLVGLKVEEDSPVVNKRLRDVDQKKILIGAILRNQGIIIPRGNDTIRPGDILYVIATKDNYDQFQWLYRRDTTYSKKVVIIGAGDVGTSLAFEMQNRNFAVKIVEKNRQKCEELAMQLQKVMVLEGDGTDKDFLIEEELNKMDVVIAVTDDEENNILVSLLGKALGIKKAVVRINRLSYMSLVSSIGIDVVVSSRLAAVKAILSFIRKGKVLSVTPLKTEDAEVIEAEAVAGSQIIDRPLRDLNFPEGAIIGAVIRGENVIIPKGDTAILPNDKLVIFAMESIVKDIEAYLSG